MAKNSSKNEAHKITVIGAGAWGSALSQLLADNNQQVTLWVRSPKSAEEINQSHTSSHLPGVGLHSGIRATCDFTASLARAEFLFIVLPSGAVLDAIKKIAKIKIAKNVVLVLCSKGLNAKGGELFSETISKILPGNHLVILSGPNFAGEVASKLPTITTLASSNKRVALKVSALLANDYFFPEISGDVVTTQIAGAVKNILAIGCGIIQGLKLGENAKAALVVRGLAEIKLLAKKMGGRQSSLESASVFGDLFLTCSSEKSRNNSLGVLIGSGGDAVKILQNADKVYEGATAARLIALLARKQKVKLPLCSAINDILLGKSANKDIEAFLSRNLPKLTKKLL